MLPLWAIIVIVIALILLTGGLILLGMYLKYKCNRQIQQQHNPEQSNDGLEQNNANYQIHKQINLFYRQKLQYIMNRSSVPFQTKDIYSPESPSIAQNTSSQNGVNSQHTQPPQAQPVKNQQVQQPNQQRNILKNSSFLTSQIPNKPLTSSKLNLQQTQSDSSPAIEKKSQSSETKVIGDEVEEQGSIFARSDQKTVSFSINTPAQVIPISQNSSNAPLPSADTADDQSSNNLANSYTSHLTDDGVVSVPNDVWASLKQVPRIPMKKVNPGVPGSLPTGLSTMSIDSSQKPARALSNSSMHSSQGDNSFTNSQLKSYNTKHIIFTTSQDVPNGLARALTNSRSASGSSGNKKSKRPQEISFQPFIQDQFHNNQSTFLRSVLAQDSEVPRSQGRNPLQMQHSVDHVSMLYDY